MRGTRGILTNCLRDISFGSCNIGFLALSFLSAKHACT